MCLGEGCGYNDLNSVKKIGVSKKALTDSELRQITDLIKIRAGQKGITNFLLVAGISYHETGLVQCANNYTKGVGCSNVGNSIDCPSSLGGVLGGSGDKGGCSAKQGGIGMFQLDDGTYSDTLSTYGNAIMEKVGNIDAGVDFIIKKLGFSCNCTPCFDSRNSTPGTPSQTCGVSTCAASVTNLSDVAMAKAWFNSIRPNTAEYEIFIRALAHCYNGCKYGWSGCGTGTTTHDQIKALYSASIVSLYNKFGHEYWYPVSNSGVCITQGIFSGSGSNGNSGSNCLQSYTFNVKKGNTYTISTCGNYSGDPYVRVSGACTCFNDDYCSLGSQCECEGNYDGVATICASTYGQTVATWNYTVTCIPKIGCPDAGPFSGSGSGGYSGGLSLALYTFNVIAGKTYKISTCQNFAGDPFLTVSGACSCPPVDDSCGYGSECTCVATSTGTATIHASTYGNANASWNYIVTCK